MLWLKTWPTTHPGKWQRHVFPLNYKIYISKWWMLSDSLAHGEDAVLLGESPVKSRSGALIIRFKKKKKFRQWLEQHNSGRSTKRVNVFLMLFFRQKCDEASVGWMGWHFSKYNCGDYIFFLISCQRHFQFPRSTVVCSCNVALWDISLYLMSDGSV